MRRKGGVSLPPPGYVNNYKSYIDCLEAHGGVARLFSTPGFIFRKFGNS